MLDFLKRKGKCPFWPTFSTTLRLVCILCFLLEKILLLINSLLHAIIQTTFCIDAFNRNYNYEEVSKDLKVDFLNHPEYIEQNATLSFQVAIWRWMTPTMEHQPSAHDVFTSYGNPPRVTLLPSEFLVLELP